MSGTMWGGRSSAGKTIASKVGMLEFMAQTRRLAGRGAVHETNAKSVLYTERKEKRKTKWKRNEKVYAGGDCLGAVAYRV